MIGYSTQVTPRRLLHAGYSTQVIPRRLLHAGTTFLVKSHNSCSNKPLILNHNQNSNKKICVVGCFLVTIFIAPTCDRFLVNATLKFTNKINIPIKYNNYLHLVHLDSWASATPTTTYAALLTIQYRKGGYPGWGKKTLGISSL